MMHHTVRCPPSHISYPLLSLQWGMCKTIEPEDGGQAGEKSLIEMILNADSRVK